MHVDPTASIALFAIAVGITPCGRFEYTFNLARVIEGFVEAVGLRRYALYVFDYGAPVGYRLAVAHPERVAAIVSQNGNAYLEGFSDAWGTWQSYWKSPTAAASDGAVSVNHSGGAGCI